MAAIDRQAVLDAAAIHLPANNTMTAAQMSTILEIIITQVGDDDTKFGEVLCRFMAKVADINAAKAPVDQDRLASERLGDHARSYNNSKSSSDAWNEFKRSLSDICPLYGYTPPLSIGFKINSGKQPDPITECIDPNRLTL